MQFMNQIFSFQIGDIIFFFIKYQSFKNTNIFKIQPPFSYQIQTLSHKIQSNPFNFHYPGYQISNAQLGGTFKWVASLKLFLVDRTKHY